jgi:phosphoglycolate phosphatase
VSDLHLVMFDFDGTLVDSQWAITQVAGEAFTAAGLPAPPVEQVRRVVGMQLEAAIAQLLQGVVDDIHDGHPLTARLARSYRDAFFRLHTSPEFHEPLIDGAKDALEALDHPRVFVGIATAKGRRALTASLERHGIARYFVTLKTADDGPGKPHPQILLDAMAEFGVAPARTLVVGDTTYDMELARNAGARALGVAWGYHAPQDLLAAGAERVLESFADMTLALVGIEGVGLEDQSCGN